MNDDAAGPTGMRLTTSQRLDWLQLIRTESIGPKTFRRLLNMHGGAAGALAALPAMAAKRGKPIRLASRDECERELAAMEVAGARFVAVGEPDYPKTLRAVDAAPPLIALRGSVDVLHRPMVAIVGSRNASAAGLAFTERLARELADAGFVIVSGLARGIDARAHRACIQSGTIAVLAGGLSHIYPPEHAGLAGDMTETGALITEMPISWEPRGRDFPRRNRIVSGLSLGTVIIEAARNSGSLITARFALEQGREVFAVPGSPLDPRADGTNGLLREGATLCTSAQDVITALAPLIGHEFPQPDLEEIGHIPMEPLWDEWDAGEEQPVPLFDQRFELDEPQRKAPVDRQDAAGLAPAKQDTENVRSRVTRLLGPSPVLVDDLVRAAGCTVAEVRGALLDLELAGRIEKHGGGLISLIEPANPV